LCFIKTKPLLKSLMNTQPVFIDTHCHIYIDEFTNDVIETLKRAKDNNIVGIIMPAIDSETHNTLLKLANEEPNYLWPMMGLHPCYVKEDYKEQLAIAKGFTNQNTVAIGEIGLDFYWDRTYEKQQIEVFNTQIEYALSLNLPINIHCRNATQECINIVKSHQNGKLKGIFHCFSGSYETAKQVRDLNFYMGIGGVVTYKNAGLGEVLQKFSINDIVLETDAPYLSPIPFRGKRNEPSYIINIATKLCEVFNCTMSELSEATMANTKIVFDKVNIK
jgi:TatD DNase family protein